MLPLDPDDVGQGEQGRGVGGAEHELERQLVAVAHRPVGLPADDGPTRSPGSLQPDAASPSADWPRFEALRDERLDPSRPAYRMLYQTTMNSEDAFIVHGHGVGRLGVELGLLAAVARRSPAGRPA